ncbi:MAG TPA: hypothetical protein VJZ71_21645 [Phycisphaerae bacterium]|nr:hypothetical protein [Phycisphaerae bacterium]
MSIPLSPLESHPGEYNRGPLPVAIELETPIAPRQLSPRKDGETEPNWYEARTIDEIAERGRAALAEGDYERAAQHYAAAAGDSPDLNLRDRLQDALKLRYSWMLVLHTLGLVGPLAADEGVSRARMFFHFALMGIAGMIIKLGRAGPEMERAAIIGLCCLFGIVILAKIADFIATLVVRADHNGALAVSGGDVVGVSLGMASLILSGIAAYAFAATQQQAWAAASIILFADATAIRFACRTKRPLGRILMAMYVVLINGAAGFGIFQLALHTVPGNLGQRLPTLGAVLILIAFLMGIGAKLAQNTVVYFVGSGMRMLDDTTFASRPGGFTLSDSRLRRLHPELYGIRGLFFGLFHRELGLSAKDARDHIRQAIAGGDAQPAVVVSDQPLVVAAYSDDLDAAVLLEFDVSLTKEFGLTRGRRLVSVNTYMPMQYRHLGKDVEFGPNSTQVWGNVSPHIVDFLTDDEAALHRLRQSFRAEEWSRLRDRLKDRMAKGDAPRDGRPLYCHVSRAVLKGEDGE